MTKRYHIWTIGCQMNEADSGRVAAELDRLGYVPTADPEDAEVVVLNTCVVRQSAEDRVVGRLWSLKPLKDRDPNRVIAVMGCMVGVRPDHTLTERFPFVDVFMPPSDPTPLLGFLDSHEVGMEAKALEDDFTWARHFQQDMSSPEAAAIGLIDTPERPHVDSEPIHSSRLLRPDTTRSCQRYCRACGICHSRAWPPSRPTCRSCTGVPTPAPSASFRSGEASNAAVRSRRSSTRSRVWSPKASARSLCLGRSWTATARTSRANVRI